MAIFNTVYGGEWKWKPWANAICYFPFETDMNDTLGNKTFTTRDSWISITTIDGVSALYNNWNWSASINVWFNNTAVPSVLMWIKPVKTTNSMYIWVRSTSWGDQDRSFKIDSNKFTYIRYSGSYVENITNPWGWICVGIIDDASNWPAVYINWTKYSNSSAYTFTILNWDVWILCRNNNWSYSEKTQAYMSKLVLYSTVITEDEYTNYYNKTKSNYWL